MDTGMNKAMTALEAYRPEKKASAKAFVEQAAPLIRQKLAEGASLRKVYDLVKETGGIEITFATFKTYLYAVGK